MNGFMKILMILLGTILSPLPINPSGITGMIIIEKEALLAGVPFEALASICFVESRLKLKTYVHRDGGSPSYGVCQIKYATAKGVGYRGSKKELNGYATNVKYAAKYLRYQIDRYNGDIRKAVLAYNAGSYKIKYKIGKKEIAINESYFKKVIKAHNIDKEKVFNGEKIW